MSYTGRWFSYLSSQTEYWKQVLNICLKYGSIIGNKFKNKEQLFKPSLIYTEQVSYVLEKFYVFIGSIFVCFGMW